MDEAEEAEEERDIGMTDEVTKRQPFHQILKSQNAKHKLKKIIEEEVNSSIIGTSKVRWRLVWEDPGYNLLSQESEAYDEFEGEHMGVHVLFNDSPDQCQNVHIDGIGLPLADIPDKLEEFQGPLSVAFMLSVHRPTQVGEMFDISTRFFDVLDYNLMPDDFLEELNLAFERNKLMFDEQLPYVKAVKRGTFIAFPKNGAIHRGLARGLQNLKRRATTYATLVRENQLETYTRSKMETAEFSPGFATGIADRTWLELWFIQFLVDLEVPLCCNFEIFLLFYVWIIDVFDFLDN